MNINHETLRAYLIGLAQAHHPPIDYNEIAAAFETSIESWQDITYWGEIIDDISRSEHRAGRPMLVLLCAGYLEKNQFGVRFLKLAQEEGLHAELSGSREEFVQSELKRLYDYWSEHEA